MSCAHCHRHITTTWSTLGVCQAHYEARRLEAAERRKRALARSGRRPQPTPPTNGGLPKAVGQ